MFGRALQMVHRRITHTGVRHYEAGHYTPPTYNELPVPQGCWKEAYARDQKKFNTILFGGMATLLGTIAIGRINGWLYFNFLPPKQD